MNEYYEFIGGTSRKFWFVGVVGKVVFVVFGRIGSEGQTTTKVLHSETAAREYAWLKAQEKLGKGYVRKEPAAWIMDKLRRLSAEVASTAPPSASAAPSAVGRGNPSPSGSVSPAPVNRVSERSDRVIDL